jgi:hypothetical protein
MIAPESAYPYITRQQACKYNASVGLYTITGYADVAINNPSALMAAVAQQPVSAGIDAMQSVFQSYRSGIIPASTCGTSVDHAVLVIGYGSDATTGQ